MDRKLEDRRQIDDTYARLSIRDFRENMAEALNLTSFERKPIVLTKNGEERVGIVPLEYVWFLDQLSKKIDLEWLVLKNRTTEMVWEELKLVVAELDKDRESSDGISGDASIQPNKVSTPP